MPTTPTLRPFQVIGRDFLAHSAHAILADRMGCGKTPQALTAAVALGLHKRGRVLIVAPLATALGWQREAKVWLPANAPAVQILRRKDAIPTGPCVAFLAWTDLDCRLADLNGSPAWDLVIGDEAHRAKNAKSAMSKALVGYSVKDDLTGAWIRHTGLRDITERLWLMTGTPMPNGRPIELVPLLQAVQVIGAPGKRTKSSFLNDYAKQSNQYAPTGYDYQGARNLGDLNQWLAASGAFLRRDANDVAGELPALVRSVAPLAVSKASMPKVDTPEMEAAVAAVLAGKRPEFEEYSAMRAALGVAKAKASAAWIVDHLEDTSALVAFVHHREVGVAIQAALAAEDIRAEFASSADDVAARQAKVDRFADKAGPRVLIASMEACGTGMNGMQLRTSTGVFCELPMEVRTLDQAEGRIRRMRPDGTQADLAEVFLLTAPCALEEAIASMLRDKADNVEKTLGGGAHETSATAQVAPTPEAKAEPTLPADAPHPATLPWSWRKGRDGGWLVACQHPGADSWSQLDVTVTNRQGKATTVTLTGKVASGSDWSVWTHQPSAGASQARDRSYLQRRALERGVEASDARPLTQPEQVEASWAHGAACTLTGCDADHATTINDMGWNKADGLMGRILSGLPPVAWDSSTLALARAMLPKYHRQVGQYPALVVEAGA